MSLKDGVRSFFKDAAFGQQGKRLLDRLENAFSDEEEAGLLNDLLDEVEERGKEAGKGRKG